MLAPSVREITIRSGEGDPGLIISQEQWQELRLDEDLPTWARTIILCDGAVIYGRDDGRYGYDDEEGRFIEAKWFWGRPIVLILRQ